MILRRWTLWIFWIALFVTAIILFLQFPIAYYSQDISFHASRILSAKAGDYFTEGVSGFKILYPTLYHFIWGNVARLFNLDMFWTFRIIQVFNFAALLLAGAFLFSVVLKNRELGFLCALMMVFFFYAPTGKRILLQIPSVFSIPFLLSGLACLFLYFDNSRFRYNLLAGGLLGFAVTLWWWNVIPVGAILLAAILVFRRQKKERFGAKGIFLFLFMLMLPQVYTIWSLVEIREILPYYFSDSLKPGVVRDMGFPGALILWMETLVLRGNQEFFKYLFPEVIKTANGGLLFFGIVSSVYFYLVAVPINLAALVIAMRMAFQRKIANSSLRMLFWSAMFVFILSLPALFFCDMAKLRRIQFYGFIFILPIFGYFLNGLFGSGRGERIRVLIALCAFLALMYSSVYSTHVVFFHKEGTETGEVIDFIRKVADEDGARIFIAGCDARMLAGSVRFTGFTLHENPEYFCVDKSRAKNLYDDYLKIIELKPDYEAVFDKYDVEYAVISKKSLCDDVAIGRHRRPEFLDSLLEHFSENNRSVLDNSKWAIFYVGKTSDGSRVPGD